MNKNPSTESETPAAVAGAAPCSAIDGYIPEVWSVQKDVIYAATHAVESGLEYVRECLDAHDAALGRTTRKNKVWAETMENDIRHMERTLAMLKACGPNDELRDGAGRSL
jgi:hypothetical protein